ncbi:hypothetical protein HGM15179_017875 [Zosterops borbonicus]|uniref:RNase H type-1 domain-containing protein n=1 Tax=Zosterops borbonicus TaxID=364589 RepID=A0A8K1G014_9PASS|nr:hypothetical protein HGM15179_017875 [Zosterops borbonicus]
MTIRDDPKTLRDLHRLCGSINWVHLLLGITTEDIALLFNLLCRREDLYSLCTIMLEVRESITKVQEALSSSQAHQFEPNLFLQLAILGSSLKSVMTWRDPKIQKWESDVQVVEGYPQIAELAAVIRAFEKFQEPINLVINSAYVAGVAMRPEHSFLKEVSNSNLYCLLSKLVYLISHRKQSFHIMHVTPHIDLSGAVTQGNRRANVLAMSTESANVPDICPSKVITCILPPECPSSCEDVPSLQRASQSHCGLVPQLSNLSDSLYGFCSQPLRPEQLPTLAD